MRADQAEHDALGLRHEAQRREIAGARRVVFEQEVIDLGVGEETLGHRFVTAGAEIMALEIAAAHMNADDDIGRAIGDRLVDAVDIEIDQRVRIAADSRDLRRGCRIAQQGDGDLVELDIAAAGLAQARRFPV